MRALLVSLYAKPDLKFSNTNVVRQALSLRHDHGIDVDILTWPFERTGNNPGGGRRPPLEPRRLETQGLVYHLVDPPNEWSERTLRDATWNEAVAFGIGLLESLRPDVVHLHHWYGLWWMLESAQRLGIRTVYTNHDWGMACLRTVLVTGRGELCDSRLSVDKCAQCIRDGRNVLGRINEWAATTAPGRWLIDAIYRSPFAEVFERREAVRFDVRDRVALALDRIKRILPRLSALFTPSEFGRRFFHQLGATTDRIRVIPWYHDPVETGKLVEPDQPFTITYIGRVSPEKGVHLIFEALGRVRTSESLRLIVAGANSTSYCQNLQRRFHGYLGQHSVEWLGWSDTEPLYRHTDVTIIPSTWIDNTPLALVEALSYKVPVIATSVPTIEELVTHRENGYLADYGSADSLAAAIEAAVADKTRIRSGNITFPRVKTCCEYTLAVKEAYEG